MALNTGKAMAWLGHRLGRRHPAPAIDSGKAAKRGNVRAYIYQIYYSEETRKSLDAGFIPLDNSRNMRPDWREYQPMREYLLNNVLDETCYYGFFSPKFKQKTFLDSKAVFEFINTEAAGCDIVFFSPGCDLQSLFLNIFVQGDYFHPGLLDCTEKFLNQIGMHVDLRDRVMDTTDTVFCNYFVAKPKFWRTWLAINEKLFSCAETESPLRKQLNAPTEHKGVPLKVFIMERTASLMLAADENWVKKSYNPFILSVSQAKPFCDNLETAIICDALKKAYRRYPFAAYKKTFAALLKEKKIPQTRILPSA